jgi:DNA-binding transcriptional LysR family regulator
LSVQIRALEGLLNVRLCERDTTMVRLTMAGEVFLAKARALLQHAQEAAEAARGHQGVLRIGNPGMFGTSFLPEALDTYQRRFPKVDLSLVDIEIEHAHPRAVEDRAIQIGFVYGPRLQDLKVIEHVLVMDVPICVVLGRGTPLASLREAPLARLAEQPLLALAESPNHGKDMLALFRAKKLAPKAVKKVRGYAAYLAMLAGGAGCRFCRGCATFCERKGWSSAR